MMSCVKLSLGEAFILSDTMIFICRVFLALVEGLGTQFQNLSCAHRVRVIGGSLVSDNGRKVRTSICNECGSVMRQ